MERVPISFSLRPAHVWWRVSLIPALPALLVAASAATYRAQADGERAAFLRVLAIAAGAGVVVYGVIRSRRPVTSVWPLLGMVALLLVPVALHAGRIVHPVRRTLPLVDVADSFGGDHLDERRWTPSVSPPATLRIENGAVQLTTPPGATGYLELRAPFAEPWWLRGPVRWLLPATFDERQFDETLSWQAAVERRGAFFIMLDTPRLLIQMAAYGLHISYQRPGAQFDATEVEIAALGETGGHEWRLRRDGQRIDLSLDGRLVWARPAGGPLGFIRFGETRTDPQHGGMLELRTVRYRQWWSGTAARG